MQKKRKNKANIINEKKVNVSFQEKIKINDEYDTNNNYSNNNINSFYQQIPFHQEFSRNNSQTIEPIKISQENVLMTEETIKDEDEEEEDEKEEDETIKKNNENKLNYGNLVKQKCSLNEHNDVDAIFYCQECRIYMCNECEKTHSGLLKNHHFYEINKNINEIFTGLCTEPNHSMNLDYYCKTHNKLCCAACISKIRCKGNGKHKNCKVFYISKIKNKKKNKLEENIKSLKELSIKLEPSIKELKTIFEKIKENKEDLKIKIQNIFTKIRNGLNEREDDLLLEIDKKFNDLYFNEELILEAEKLPNMVKISLEKEIKENEWDDENKLNKLINDCINIENNIQDINKIYEKIKSYNSEKDFEFELNPKEDEINQMLEKIKNMGSINVINNNKINNRNNQFVNQLQNINQNFQNVLQQGNPLQNNISNLHNLKNNYFPQRSNFHNFQNNNQQTNNLRFQVNKNYNIKMISNKNDNDNNKKKI